MDDPLQQTEALVGCGIGALAVAAAAARAIAGNSKNHGDDTDKAGNLYCTWMPTLDYLCDPDQASETMSAASEARIPSISPIQLSINVVVIISSSMTAAHPWPA